MVIFLGLLVASIAVAAMVVLGEYSLPTKAIIVGMVGTAAYLQLDPSVEVHFLVPFGLQFAVCIWYYFASQFE